MKAIMTFHYTGLFTGDEKDITVYFCNDYFHIHEYKSALNQGFTNVFAGEVWYDRFMIGCKTNMESLQTAVKTYLDKRDETVYHLIYEESN